MKVIANHALDPHIEHIELNPNAGPAMSWIWKGLDVADGEPQEKVFCLQFANSEMAGEFKAKFKEHQAKMKQLLTKGDTSNQAKEMTKGFGGLFTEDE